jgi:hypothetical protein
MSLPSALTKTFLNWSAGNNGGSLDTGTTTSSTWYHVFAIMNPASGAVDVLTSLSLTPLLPTGFGLYRRIGSVFIGSGGSLTPYTQSGDEFLWTTPYQALNGAALATTAQLLNMLAPPNVPTWVMFNAEVTATTASATAVLFWSPTQAAQSPGTPQGNAQLYCASSSVGGDFAQVSIRTNGGSPPQINWQANTTTGGLLYLNQQGFIDRRGRDL